MPTRKPPANAPLLKLDPAVQAEIFERMQQAAGYAEIREWLEQDRGISTSISALGRFFQWMQAKEQHETDNSILEETLRMFREQNPGATAREMAEAGDAIFTALALSRRDSKEFVRIQRLIGDRERFAHDVNVTARELEMKTKALAQKDTALEQAERKLAILEAKVAEATKALGEGGKSAEEREARMREIFGIS